MDEKNEIKPINARGQNLVEFALVLPFLMLVVFGVLDLGRAFWASVTVANLAREGARYATVHPGDLDADWYGLQQYLIASATAAGIDITTSEITVVCTDDNSDDECDSILPVSVTVSYDFDLVMGWVLPSPVTVTRSVEMMVP